MPDLTLLQQWTDGRDAQAFKALVSQYAPMVYATCSRILSNGAEAEDVTQECFEVLARTQKRPTEHLGAWLHRVATNRALDHVRSKRRRRQREAGFVAEQPSHAELVWDDIYDCVDEAVAELPEELRACVVAHYLLGESHGEIARATGMPRRTVSHRIARGVELLGESLRRRGVHVASGVLGTLLTAHVAEAAVVPAPLIGRLGMLALAHSTNTVAGASLSAAAPLVGGFLAMKKITVGIIVAAAIIVGLWFVAGRKSNSVEPASKTLSAQEDNAASREPTATSEKAGKPSSSPGDSVADATQSPVASTEPEALPGIFGTVVDEQTGAAVPGATVIAVDARREQQDKNRGESDGEGKFEITGLRGDNYFLVKDFGPDDYTGSAEADVKEIRLKDGERREGILIVARKGGTVSGVVKGADGRAVAGAKLTVNPANNESWRGIKASFGSGVGKPTESDESGHYMLRGLKLDKPCFVTATVAGYAPVNSETFTLTHSGTVRQVDMVLSAGSVITGWVVDRHGAFKPDTKITFNPKVDAGSLSNCILMRAAMEKAAGLKSDSAGAFRIEGLPAGTYAVFAGAMGVSKYGWPSDGAGTTVEVDGIHAVDGVMVTADSANRGEHTITGNVVSANGEPLPGALVDLIAVQQPPDHLVTQTDEKGHFLAEGLGTGTYIVAATLAGYSQGVLALVGVDGPDLALVLGRNSSIRGRVLAQDTGKALAGARVSIARQDGISSADLPVIIVDILGALRKEIGGQDWSVTGEDGGFELPSVSAGTVQLKAEHSGYAVGYSRDLLVMGEHPVDGAVIQLVRGAAVEGTVRNTAGVPVEGASIMLIPSVLPGETPIDTHLRLIRATNDDVGGPNVLALTGGDGTFRIEGLVDGDYCMRALASGYAYSPVVPVVVANGASQNGYQLILDPGGALEGHVFEGDVPQSGVRVEILYEGPNASCKITYTDSAGHFAGTHLVPGEHQLRVVHERRTQGEAVKAIQVMIASGKTTRQDVRYGGNAVTGTVAGLPDPETWMVAVLDIPPGVDPEAPPDPSIDWQAYVMGYAHIGSDGHYMVGDLPGGDYKLVVIRLKDGRLEVKNVWQTITINGDDLSMDVTAGENLPFDIPVPE